MKPFIHDRLIEFLDMMGLTLSRRSVLQTVLGFFLFIATPTLGGWLLAAAARFEGRQADAMFVLMCSDVIGAVVAAVMLFSIGADGAGRPRRALFGWADRFFKNNIEDVSPSAMVKLIAKALVFYVLVLAGALSLARIFTGL